MIQCAPRPLKSPKGGAAFFSFFPAAALRCAAGIPPSSPTQVILPCLPALRRQTPSITTPIPLSTARSPEAQRPPSLPRHPRQRKGEKNP
ncbi:hypothetical protein LY76DRAFT_297041 [Colletotrichum caudatum]|nr:hypothetical protein LY76DRAFT_297041 [Colletotrichum caudatum]